MRIRSIKVRVKAFFKILILFGLVVSCNSPFSPRTPEAPESQPRTNWKPPTQASDVLDNLRNAIQDKNLTNYLSSFTDSPDNTKPFRFRPDQNASIRFPGVWDGWSLDRERTYISNAFQSIPGDSLPSLIFVGDILETPLSDSTVIIGDYELYIPHTRTSPAFPRLTRGRAEFHLSINDEGYWAIHFWRDESQEGSSSWSEMKALFVE